MNKLGIIYGLLNELINSIANLPLLAIIGALAGLIGFVITQWNTIGDIWNDIGERRDNKAVKEINSALPGAIKKCEEEPVLGVYNKITSLTLVVRRGLKEIMIDLNPGGIVEARIPSKSMDDAVKALWLYISEKLRDYSIVRDQKILHKALEAFLFESIVKNSGINHSFETAAIGHLNKVTEDKEIGSVFNIIKSLNYQMKGENLRYEDNRLLRILLIESTRGDPDEE